MKKFLLVMFALILLTTSAQAAQPVRIARLPIIFQSTVPDINVCAELEMKIARATHIPLNGTLKVAEYLPADESSQALNNIWRKMRSENKRAKIQDAMRPLADKLDADIVICPILRQYSQNESGASGLSGETYISSQVRVELIVYDRRTDEFIDKKATQTYRDSYHPLGTAATLAKICFDQVIDDSKIFHRIRAIGK